MVGLVKSLLLLMMVTFTVGHDCPDKDRIACPNQDYCMTINFFCDNDDDCDDGSDEDPELCKLLNSYDCGEGRGTVECLSEGESRCLNYKDYCFSDPPCDGDLDPRICQMLEDDLIQPLEQIIVTLPKLIKNGLERSEVLGEKLLRLLDRSIEHPSCPSLYTLVGDQCLSFFTISSVSWGEARAFCQMLKGELVTFTSPSHYASLVDHLKDAQFTGDFWVGGRHVNETLGWTWVDDTPMELGTPYWAVRYQDDCQTRNLTTQECYNYVQAPKKTVSNQCVAITYQHYYYMTDEACLSTKSPLCLLKEV